MRIVLLAWALVAVAAPALADDGRLVAREGWTQFIPDWQSGPASFVYGERNVSVPSFISFATDGATWLYATNETIESLQTPREGCAPADNITAVVITTYACSFAEHPSVACVRSSVCDEAMGEPTFVATPTTRPGGPSPRFDRPPEPQPLTPEEFAGPDCGAMTMARCTPGPGAALAIAAIAGAVLAARPRAK